MERETSKSYIIKITGECFVAFTQVGFGGQQPSPGVLDGHLLGKIMGEYCDNKPDQGRTLSSRYV